MWGGYYDLVGITMDAWGWHPLARMAQSMHPDMHEGVRAASAAFDELDDQPQPDGGPSQKHKARLRQAELVKIVGGVAGAVVLAYAAHGKMIPLPSWLSLKPAAL